MTFTVLGASGSIGSALKRSLEDRGERVYAPPRGDPGIFERPLGRLVYCIGLTGDFIGRLLETVESHVELLREVLERADFESVLYLSSTRVYGGLELGEEGAPLLVRPENPSDVYNASKLLGEALCLGSCGNRATVARLSNVIGPGARSPLFARLLLEDALAGRELRIATHSSSVKDYVDIRDVVELLPRLFEGRHRIYNVASGRQTTHRELAEGLASLTGSKLVWAPDAPDASFPPTSIERIVDEFDFAPRPLRQSLEDMVAAERDPG